MTSPRDLLSAGNITIAAERRAVIKELIGESSFAYRPGAGIRFSPHFYTNRRL